VTLSQNNHNDPKKLLTSTERDAILPFESGYNIRNLKCQDAFGPQQF